MDRDGAIVFAPKILGALFHVSENGGAPAPVTTPTGPDTPIAFLSPSRAAVDSSSLISSPGPDASGIYVGSLDGATPVVCCLIPARAVYVPPRRVRGPARCCSRERRRSWRCRSMRGPDRRGRRRPVAQDVAQGADWRVSGHLPHRTAACWCIAAAATRLSSSLVWLDRSGKQIGTKTARTRRSSVGDALSRWHTGAVTVRTSQTTSDVWLDDLRAACRRGSRLAREDAAGRCGRRTAVPSCLWRSAARRLATTSSESRPAARALKPVCSTRAPTRRHSTSRPMEGCWCHYHDGWHDERRHLARAAAGAAPHRTKYLDGPVRRTARAVLARRPLDRVLVRRVGPVSGVRAGTPATGAKRQISTQGGSRPRWRRDGRELYYVAADGTLMAVPVTLGAGTLQVGSPVRLFDPARGLPAAARSPMPHRRTGRSFWSECRTTIPGRHCP